MRAYLISEFGQPGGVGETADPAPAQGEVLVRVTAASVNPMDAFAAAGATRAWAETRLPFVPGIDAAGVIERVGPGVKGLQPGLAVIGSAATKAVWGAGTFAELVALPATAIAAAPAGLDPSAAATLPQAGLTALAALDSLDPSAGQTILVVGATGGVGSFFTVLARARGARVLALARPENADYARRLGATEVYDRTRTDLVDQLRSAYPAGVDALADFSGNGELVGALAGLLRPAAKVTSSAARGLDTDALTARGLAFSPANRADTSRLPELISVLGERPMPDVQPAPLEQAGEALTQVAGGHTRGKLVLLIG